MESNEAAAPADVVDVSLSQAAAAEPDAKPEVKDPNWLPARLERERRSMLKDLGVEKVDDAKAAIAELRKIRDAEKTETERLRSELAAASEKAKRSDYLEGVLALKAKSELATLTDAQREAVLGIAPEDSGAQLKAIETLRPTWSQQVAAMVAPKAPAANTAPVAKAPQATAPEAENVLNTYERLRKLDPFAAANFRLANRERYEEALKTRG